MQDGGRPDRAGRAAEVIEYGGYFRSCCAPCSPRSPPGHCRYRHRQGRSRPWVSQLLAGVERV